MTFGPFGPPARSSPRPALDLPRVEVRLSLFWVVFAIIRGVQITAAAATPKYRTRADAADHAWIVAVVVGVNALVIAGMWLRHGGLANAQGPGAVATAVGQVTGLFGAYAVLLELLLMSRLAWLERFVGLDRMAVWHRWNGFVAVWLLVAHTVFITLGYAASSRSSALGQTGDFIRHYPDVLMAYVAVGLFLAGRGDLGTRRAPQAATRDLAPRPRVRVSRRRARIRASARSRQ